MKIIHTADLHLGSALVGVADSNLRRTELLKALERLSEVADNMGVTAIIVAGDLFDEKSVSAQTVESVSQIVSHSKAQWYVLRGNHGDKTPYNTLAQMCPQIHFFADQWTTYLLQDGSGKNVAIVGRELGDDDAENWLKLSVDANNYNILVLHGDVDSGAYGLIDKKAISAQPINYVALGHRHSFAAYKFGRVKACYSGVLEPRGFDETADSGFVVIDTEADEVTFHKQYIRRIETVRIDVTDITTDLQLENTILDKTASISAQNYLNIEFFGALNNGINLMTVSDNALNGSFFSLRLKDCTELAIDTQTLQKETSLRGEFVKLAMQISDETERNEVLKMGLKFLAMEGKNR